jgi:dienelactone hydrolase
VNNYLAHAVHGRGNLRVGLFRDIRGMRPTVAMLIVGVVAFTTGAQAAQPIELVQGQTPLQGFLFRPEGRGPFPTVVALHGCGGLVARQGRIGSLFMDWGNRLAAAGLAAVFPDSFSSRGVGSQCNLRDRKVRAAQEQLDDAVAARTWLQAQPWAAKDRVALLGWSDGGVATLWAVRRRAGAADGTSEFRSAVALYPGCRALGNVAWSARVPTLILVGRSDDLTPAIACEQMVAGARGRSARAQVVVYPGAYHSFDRSDYPVRELTGLAFTPDGSGKAHLGTHATARADALRRVPQWLAR